MTERHVVLRSVPSAKDVSPSALMLQTAEGIINRVVLEYGTATGDNGESRSVLAVSELIPSIQTVVAGVLSKDIRPESYVRQLLWQLSRLLGRLDISVADAGVDILQKELDALPLGE